jgi:serine/threonine protein kinase
MIGKIISHYKILEQAGRGGMGVVYKAEDINLKRTVALKFLPSTLSFDEEAKKRFKHEAQSASALDHPNICTIYEIGESEEGQLFISMALYEGETLKEKIAKGKIGIEEAMDITLQICAGLDKAHQNNIVHRDIKPANIFITSEGIVKILDFGIAKVKGQTRLTLVGATAGTLEYMSPEQARGEEIDYRTDIWSAGIIMYEMLTGSLPFKGEYDQALIYSILNQVPDLNQIPARLRPLIKKAIAKSPSDRYKNVKEMIDDRFDS